MYEINAQPDGRIELEQLGDSITVRGRLALLGWPSLAAWAKANGYRRDAVMVAIRVWGRPRMDSRKGPHGHITKAIVRDLRATILEGRRPAQQDA